MESFWSWLGYSVDEAEQSRHGRVVAETDLSHCSDEEKLYYDSATIMEESEQLGLEVWALSQRWRNKLMPVAVQQTLRLKADRLQHLKRKMVALQAEYISRIESNPAWILSKSTKINSGNARAKFKPQMEEELEGAETPSSKIKFHNNERTSIHFLAKQSTFREPEHGHWVPEEVRRSSSEGYHAETARRLGGCIIFIDCDHSPDGKVECAMVEPMKKYFGDAEFNSAGLIFFLHGLRPTLRLLDEWNQVLKRTKVLDNGFSVVIPDLQGSVAVHPGALENVIFEVLRKTGASQFMVWGKGWGALQALELTAIDSLRDKFSGVALFSPTAPVDVSCNVSVPVYMIWAKDDKTLPADQKQAWMKAIRRSSAPVICRDVRSTGSDMARLLRKNSSVAEEILQFTIASVLTVHLAEFMQSPCSSDGRDVSISEESLTMMEELPGSFAERLCSGEHDDCARSAFELECSRAGTNAAAQKLNALLEFWMASDMRIASSSE